MRQVEEILGWKGVTDIMVEIGPANEVHYRENHQNQVKNDAGNNSSTAMGSFKIRMATMDITCEGRATHKESRGNTLMAEGPNISSVGHDQSYAMQVTNQANESSVDQVVLTMRNVGDVVKER